MLTSIKNLLLLFVCTFLSLGAFAQSFLKANGQNIVNEEGEEVLLRGMGLGGWMVQEGYMLQTASFASAQHQIRQKITELIGENATQDFYDAWLANHVTRADIDSLKSWGFNSVRLPMHYNLFTLPIEDEPVPGQNTWLPKGFELTDALIDWCAANEMYVILDLHAAPGGQGYDQGISDYDPSKPSLWESSANQSKMVALWRRIAERYKDEAWVGGYDLLNEPNWDLPGGVALRNLYEQITTEIREVDQRHIIFIEGNWFANDFTGLTPPWDDNLVYSPHKYWSFNDQSSIQWVLNLREQYNVPLYLGESGENSNTWFRDAINLLESNNIGWAWWPMKKIEAIAGPLSVEKTSRYQTLLDFWTNGGSTPNQNFVITTLMEITEKLKIENCYYQKEVIDAMFRQIDSEETIPFQTQEIPGKVFATDYDMGRNGSAYFDTDLATYHVSTGNFTTWNTGWAYRNDGVDIERSNDDQGNGFNVGWINDGEWMLYDVKVNEEAVYDINVRVASAGGGGNFSFKMNDVDLTTPFYVAGTGDWQVWNNLTIRDVVLDPSMQKLKFTAHEGGFNLSLFEFVEKAATTSIDTDFLSAQTIDRNTISLNLNKRMETNSPLMIEDFKIQVNGPEFRINDLSFNPENDRQLIFQLDESLSPQDIIKITYTGTDLVAADESPLLTFNLKNVENTLPIINVIPGRVEAEDYFFESGVDLENTFDAGGGKNIGNLDAGDYLDYFVNASNSGTFDVIYRTASNDMEGQIKLYWMISEDERRLLQTVNFAPTGDLQTFENTSSTPVFEFPRGQHHLRMEVSQGGFNMNWWEVQQLTVSTRELSQTASLKVFPNPSNGNLWVSSEGIKELRVYDLLGNKMKQLKLTGNEESINLNLAYLPKGSYILHGIDEEGKFISELIQLN